MANASNIKEKVQFWQEQDKINQALIPRVTKLHEIVSDLSGAVEGTSAQIAAAEARAVKRSQKHTEKVRSRIEEAIEAHGQELRKDLSAKIVDSEDRAAKVAEAKAQEVRAEIQDTTEDTYSQLRSEVKKEIKAAEQRAVEEAKSTMDTRIKSLEDDSAGAADTHVEVLEKRVYQLEQSVAKLAQRMDAPNAEVLDELSVSGTPQFAKLKQIYLLVATTVALIVAVAALILSA